MNIPKWLVNLWVVEIIITSAIYTPGAIPPAEAVGQWFLTFVVFLIAACITAVWFLWKRAGTTAAQRFFVILWIVGLVVANLLRHLRPAAVGAKSSVSSLGPIVALAVAGAIALTVWGVRKFHKPHPKT
jgi:hypothetical protein